MDAKAFLKRCLEAMVNQGASDLHLKAGVPPRLRVGGRLIEADIESTSNELLIELSQSLMNVGERERFANEGDVDFAFEFESLGRFRANVFSQRGTVSLSIRMIRDTILSFEELHIPEVAKKLALMDRGLILIVGAASAGKSTTISAMVNHINENKSKHIVMIEDPIEYIHADKKSLIDQREVGQDTVSFLRSLRFVVREDPDVIVIGEIRDEETFSSALRAAETGHLVIATLHARSVLHTFKRLSVLYAQDQIRDLFHHLSFNLNAIIAQRLLFGHDESMQIPAFEVLVATPSVQKLIRDERFDKLHQAIISGRGDGMCTFNQSLLELLRQGLIDKEVALAASDNPQALEMNIKGVFLDESSGGILGT